MSVKELQEQNIKHKTKGCIQQNVIQKFSQNIAHSKLLVHKKEKKKTVSEFLVSI